MAERKPLTLVDNRPGELPAGDNLPYSVLPQAWTHPSLGAPIGSMLVYAAIARGASPPDTFGYWATETSEASTDALVTITGIGYLGFDLVNSDRARENLGLGDVATLDVEDLISTDTPNALEIGADGKLVATGGGGGQGVIFADFEATPGQLSAGEYTRRITVPYDYEIQGWRLTAGNGQSGNATVDVLYSSTHSGGTSSITGGLPLTMTAAATAEGSDLTGWTTAGVAGGVIVFHLAGVAGLTALRAELLVEKQ